MCHSPDICMIAGHNQLLEVWGLFKVTLMLEIGNLKLRVCQWVYGGHHSCEKNWGSNKNEGVRIHCPRIPLWGLHNNLVFITSPVLLSPIVVILARNCFSHVSQQKETVDLRCHDLQPELNNIPLVLYLYYLQKSFQQDCMCHTNSTNINISNSFWQGTMLMKRRFLPRCMKA